MKTFSALKTYLTLQVLLGLVVFAGMTLLLGEISEDVINGEPLTVLDVQLSRWLHSQASPTLTFIFKIITAFGSTQLVSCVAILVGVYLLSRRQFYWTATVWLSVFGGMGLNRLLKVLFQRERPLFADPILTLTGYSFPSGHTMAATVLYAVLAVLLVTRLQGLLPRVVSVVLACVLIILVAFSRMYLGAHFLSDVVAAIAEGLAWVALCLIVVHAFRWSQGSWRSTKKAG